MRRVNSGQPIIHSAQEFNAMAAAAEWVQSNGAAFDKFKASRSGKSSLVRVYNGTGAAVDVHKPLAIVGPYITPTSNAVEFSYNLTLECDTLDDTYLDAIAITAEPIPDGKFGMAYVSGDCIAYVNINSTSDWYATAGAGQLESSSSGCISILWRNGTSGLQLCYVRLGNEPLISNIFPASITGESSAGIYTWLEREQANGGTWQNKTDGRNSTDDGAAKEFNGMEKLYVQNGSAAFDTFMFELTSADGTKYYRFKQNLIIPKGTADGQIIYWNNTDKKFVLTTAPSANSVPVYNSSTKAVEWKAPTTSYQVITYNGTTTDFGFVRSHS